MAVGDVVSIAGSLASGASVNYQPSSGVEVQINWAVSEGQATGTDIIVYDGSNSLVMHTADFASIYSSGIGKGYTENGGSSRAWEFSVMLYVTNSIYLRFTNNGASSKTYCYAGVQTK
jgi:hypothetical protein